MADLDARDRPDAVTLCTHVDSGTTHPHLRGLELVSPRPRAALAAHLGRAPALMNNATADRHLARLGVFPHFGAGVAIDDGSHSAPTPNTTAHSASHHLAQLHGAENAPGSALCDAESVTGFLR